MIVEYRQADGTAKVFGYMMSDGPLTAATGQILRGWHHKCFHAVRKREARGNAVTGRVVSGVPTGYSIGSLVLTREEFDALGLTVEEAREQSTEYISDLVRNLRRVAKRIGKGVGDPTVLEAFWAEEEGGPYMHTHHLQLEVYQLRAHLAFAHGADFRIGSQGVHAVHEQLHRLMDRENDPGHVEPKTTDWRDQLMIEIRKQG